jgi:outer membrane protein TolC
MQMIRLVLVASIVVVWAPASFGQEALTLRAAIREVLTRNASLRAAAGSVEEANARARQAKSAFFPRVSVTESWQRSDQPVFVFSALLSSRKFTAANFAIDSLNNPNPVGFFHAGVSVEQTLFDGGRTLAAVQSAALQHDIASLTADETTSSVAVRTTEAYGRLLIARVAVRAADAAVAAAQEDLTRATLRRDAGSLNDADLLAASVRLAEARERRIQSAGDEAIARATLNQLMGSPLDRQYDLQEPAPPTAAATPNDEALFLEAESSRPDLKRAAAAEQLAGTGLRQSRASWYPQVVAQAGVEASGTELTERAGAWLFGGELRWSWSPGGAELARRAEAAARATRARAEREDTRTSAQVEILTARQRLETALQRQTVAQESVLQSRESQRIVRDRFDAGVASTADVLHVAAAVLDADVRRISATVDAMVSRAALDRAVGRQP